MNIIRTIAEKIRRNNFTCDECWRGVTGVVRDPNNHTRGHFPTLYRAPGFHYWCDNHYVDFNEDKRKYDPLS